MKNKANKLDSFDLVAVRNGYTLEQIATVTQTCGDQRAVTNHAVGVGFDSLPATPY